MLHLGQISDEALEHWAKDTGRPHLKPPFELHVDDLAEAEIRRRAALDADEPST